MAAASPFRIGLTRDFLKADGTIGFGDIGLSLFDTAPNIIWEFLPQVTPVLQAGTDRRLRRSAGPRSSSEFGRNDGTAPDRLSVHRSIWSRL